MNTQTLFEACEHIHNLLKNSKHTVLSVNFNPYHAVLTFRTTVKVCFSYSDFTFYRVKQDRDIENVPDLEQYLNTVL